MGHSKRSKPLSYFTQYAEDDTTDEAQPAAEETGEAREIVIPEDFSEVDDAALAELHSTAVEGFTALYGEGGANLSEAEVEALGVLTAGIERIQGELDVRAEAQATRAEAAAAMAARVGVEMSSPETEPEPEEGEGEEEENEDEEENAESESESSSEAQPVALANKEIRINLSGMRNRAPVPVTEAVPAGAPSTMKDIVRAAPEFGGYAGGQGLDWGDIGKGLDRRLASFNLSQFQQAAAAGRHLRQQTPMMMVTKPFDPDLVIKSADVATIDSIIRRAGDESRLPGNSLVASGGWCAPSDTIYDLCEIETRDGLFSLPEVGITRGGIKTTLGPNFADIWADTGFHYTEAEDIAGDYDGAGGGSKPCYTVECPDFTEQRLEYDGVCVNAGLLMQRGYPEVVARTVRGALVVHDFKMAAANLAAIEAGSTAVAMPANQAGAAAPLLTAIDLQVEHYKTVNRASRTGTLEAVFPFWVHGAIRSDLARRLGVDLFDVSDARIDGWFRDRGVNPQFVYGIAGQDPTGAAGTYTAWPANVKFYLYAAGTWVRGTSDIITLDTIYDSVQLGTNDFTALFTEEGSLVVKSCHDSRAVTVNICADGATHGGVEITCNGAVGGP